MPITLIIAAGGTGSRFHRSSGNPSADSQKMSPGKLFFPFLGKPLLVQTLARFRNIPEIGEIVAAVPPGINKELKSWKKKFNLNGITWVRGGKTRAESVWRALKKSHGKNAWVMVHDGARPCVSEKAIKKLVRTAAAGKAEGIILAQKVVPTIKQVQGASSWIARTVDRQFLYEAQTPQLVRRQVLERAYARHKNAFEATDEASLLENIGARVRVLSHEGWNPKITTYQDLQLSEAFMQKEMNTGIRVGIGRDTHRLTGGRKLYLGGVLIPYHKGALGHSDGDVLLHAIADAVLGAIGAGDIGDFFSDRDRRFKGIRSEKIIRKVLEVARGKGWRVHQLDTIITLEEPRLGKLKQEIRKNIAKMLHLDEENVSIKAKTAEGLGPEGRGQALTCEAIVHLRNEVL